MKRLLSLHRHSPLASILMLTADKGGGSGGGSNPVVVSLEDQLTAARAELQSSKDAHAALLSERDSAIVERDAARNEIANLTSQFNAATEAATAAQTARDAALAQVATLNSTLATTQTTLQAATTNVTRLETLCKLKGIKPDDAAPHVSQPTETYADLEAAYASAKTRDERDTILGKMEAMAKAKAGATV